MMSERKISQIWIYPIKSLGGISLQSAKVFPKGLEFDRRWMLVDTDGQFLTQRVHSNMALFNSSFINGQLNVNFQGNSISIPANHASDKLFTAHIWDDTVSVAEVSKEHSRWFSDHLGIECRLVQFPEENPRIVDPEYVPNEEHVSLADAYPFLIIGQSSMDDLNKRIGHPLSIKRFRPNFVFTGGEAYEEDNWKDISIGSTQFIGVKPCGRCALPNVDPETAEKGLEPLRTLSTYRRFGTKVNFGQNLITTGNNNDVRVGDLVTLKSSDS